VTFVANPATGSGSLAVSKNGSLVGTRAALNLIEGSNITWTIADNAGSTRVDATAAAASGVGQCTIVNRAAVQSITSGSLTSVSWDSERQDDGGWWTVGTPDKIIVVSTGLYVVMFQGCWSATYTTSFVSAGIVFSHLERVRVSDGIQEVLGASQALDLKDASSHNIQWVGQLLAGDAVRVKVYQATGVSKDFGGKNRVSGNPIADSSNAELGVVRIA
jgi:hypothetical protein